ncbi:MAG: anthranilate synthase component I family protein [Syntrophobacterales bacterium]|nr:anthranilate synthase component I family protein [Syntrophobacterales bacterium]
MTPSPDYKTIELLMNHFKATEAARPLIPFFVETLGDVETPVSLLRRVYNYDGTFLLESVEGGERWGRYSFLGLGSHYHIKVFRDTVEVHSHNGSVSTHEHNGDPLSVIRSFMKTFSTPPPELFDLSPLPRFWGGLVGYVCYEMVSFFEPVPNLLPEKEPLAHFVLPSSIIVFDNKRHTITLISLVIPHRDYLISEIRKEGIDRLDELYRLIMDNTSEYPLIYQNRDPSVFKLESPVEPEEFRKSVLKAKRFIAEGETIQIVLSQPFLCKVAPNPWLLYRLQRFINPSPYLFYCRLGDTTLVGSSPETMVRLEKGVASLRPIAGTRPRGATEQEDRKLSDELLQDEKERAEHVMLVDLGRNDLGRVAEIGTVQVTEYMVVERYSHVMHLVSHVQAELKKGLDAWDLFKATFPAGTLTGAPKVRAMQLIAELEGRPRGPYGGAVGYISFQGNMDMAITIRTGVIEDGMLTIQAGAGIVADSDPERERLETIHKAKAMERALAKIPDLIIAYGTKGGKNHDGFNR